MSEEQEYDPFEDREKVPAIGFKNEPIGTVKSIDTSEPCNVVQKRVFGTPDLDWWENKDGSRSPKQAAVFNGVDANGEKVSLWCDMPSDLFTRVKEAQKTLGRRIGTGGNVDRIYVKLTGRVAAKNTAYEKNTYAVKVEQVGKVQQATQQADPFTTQEEPADSEAFPEEPPW